MSVRRVVRSWLYAPASRPELVEKALAGQADAVICDLEDAVPPARKEQARENAVGVVGTRPAKPLFVRINAPSSPWFDSDVAAIAGVGPLAGRGAIGDDVIGVTASAPPGFAGVLIAKCESVGDVRRVADRFDDVGSTASVHCLLESALGVERAYDIATTSPRVVGIALGEADLSANLHLRSGHGLAYARSRVVTAARAAGLPSPVQSVYTQLRDPRGLRRSTILGRDLGFFGRSAIHPEQVPVINEVFTPSEGEVAQARELLASLDSAMDAGSAAFITREGRFVDPAVVESARVVLTLAHCTEHSPAGDTSAPPQEGSG